MVPPLNENGLLPEGVHDCTQEDVEARFGIFQASDHRPRLWTRLKEFVEQARLSGIIEELLLDGSFVTAKPDPNDIDMIVVVSTTHDFGSDLPPRQYNVLSAGRVRRRFGFDIVVAKAGTDQLEQAIVFFTQVRQQPALRKGLLRIKL
jgi:hypothetical protein